MTMSIATMPLTTATPAFARGPVTRAVDAVGARADGATAPADGAAVAAAPADPRCQVCDLTPAFGGQDVSPFFAEVIANLADSRFQMSCSRQCDAMRPEHENSAPSGSSRPIEYTARTSGRTSCVTSTPSRG